MSVKIHFHSFFIIIDFYIVWFLSLLKTYDGALSLGFIAVVGVLANNNLPVNANKSGALLSGFELRSLLLARTPTTAMSRKVGGYIRNLGSGFRRHLPRRVLC